MTRVGGRQEEAAQELRILSEAGEVAAQALDQWGLLRVRQGRVADASTLRERLVGEHPASPEAAEVLYLKGMAAESGGRTAEALSQYERLVENAPTSTRAALAHLRAGRIHLERGARSSAADKFDAYIEAFPDRSGRGEASYWSARARLETGDTVRGRAVLRAFLEHDPIDYYGVIGAELLGVTFDPDFRERAEPPPPPPEWMREGLRVVDLLIDAGITDGAAATVGASSSAHTRQRPMCCGWPARSSPGVTRSRESISAGTYGIVGSRGTGGC